MKAILTALLLVMGVALTGCQRSSEDTSRPEAPPTEAPAEPAAEASPDSTAETAEIGVSECDSYLERMTACIEQMPEEAQVAARSGLTQSKAAWRQAAATEAGRTALAQSCKAALDALAQNPMCD